MPVTIARQFCPGDGAQVMRTNSKQNKVLKVSRGESGRTPGRSTVGRRPCHLEQGGAVGWRNALRGGDRVRGCGLRRRQKAMQTSLLGHLHGLSEQRG